MDYSIGRLAEMTGVPVKTIRFYSDAGVLPTPGRTSSGYRRYTDEHRVHLELVRTLREIGVDLATIRSLGHRDLKQVLALHLRAVETQITALQRTRAVLRVTLDKDAPADEDLRRLHALGKLGDAELGSLLDSFIDDVGGDIRARYEWLAAMRACMLPELPAEPTTAQLDAWLELAELFADEDFRRRLREQSQDFWTRTDDAAAYLEANNTIVEEALAAVDEGIAPESPEARPVLERVLGLMGQTREELLRMFDEHDRRAEHLWRLVAIVRDVEYDSRPGTAYGWIEQAARAAGQNLPQARRGGG